MTITGAEHIIGVLTEVRHEKMYNPDPMFMERLQEAIVICREEIARKKEKENDNDSQD
jgi:hypothetical protein